MAKRPGSTTASLGKAREPMVSNSKLNHSSMPMVYSRLTDMLPAKFAELSGVSRVRMGSGRRDTWPTGQGGKYAGEEEMYYGRTEDWQPVKPNVRRQRWLHQKQPVYHEILPLEASGRASVVVSTVIGTCRKILKHWPTYRWSSWEQTVMKIENNTYRCQSEIASWIPVGERMRRRQRVIFDMISHLKCIKNEKQMYRGIVLLSIS